MDNAIVEQLIEGVRVHKFLYDLHHKDYKNNSLKAVIWNSIGKEINLSGEVVKQKWRTLRDGYTRYKKQLKSSKKKNINYLWATHLSFLDTLNPARASCSSVSLKQENLSSPAESPSPGASPVPVHFLEYVDTTPSSSTVPHNVLPNGHKRARQDSTNDENEDKIMDFLNSNTKEYDRVDLLFLSYADTFKKFPPREQALLKLELAKLFANTELTLLNENPYGVPFQSPS